ncbi:unnamed protein product [Aspergillus oryzae var. brunneus]|uniref:Unnamed protein product n=2 Tax=Aspergillus oryzae TaxID=5062 RepID=A0AAN4Y995_ASPOZ|nr:unnamed protein product [Aspergillus oryzae]GMG41750.1 unnamed protein product [Aspergillus oryzae var. brunneus]
MEDQEHPEDGLALLTQYMDAASYLIPSSDDEAASSNVLWHPDLHLDNVVPQKPENFDSLNEEEQNEIQKNLESETMHIYCEAQVYKRAPRHWAVLQQKTVCLVTGVWERRNLFFLRQSLIVLAAYWEEVSSDSGLTCPVQVTKTDLELYSEEEENIDGVGQLLTILHDQALLPHDGMIRYEDYEAAVKISQEIKEISLGWLKTKLRESYFPSSGHIKRRRTNGCDRPR